MKTEEKAVELLSCPFCGAPPSIRETVEKARLAWCSVWPCAMYGNQVPIDLWNTRASQWISAEDKLPDVDVEYSALSGCTRSAPVLVFDSFVLEHAKNCDEPERDCLSLGYYFHTLKDWRTSIQPNGRADVKFWQPLPPSPELPRHTFQIVMPGSDKPIST